MLLAIDVGNTNITIGVYDKETMRGHFRITTKLPRTSDEYGTQLEELIERQGLKVSDITGVIIASVVPGVMHSLTSSIKKYFKIDPIIVGPGTKTGIRIDTTNPREVGSDRIVDAVAAYELYGGPVLVLDYGTATTYDLVTGEGHFVAGVTAPGIRISAKALSEGAAKLPEIEIVKPKSIMAQDTITSMQAGLMYGQIGQAEFIIKQFKKESGFDNLKVVATGGLGRAISDETDLIDEYNADLTLEGLRIIYGKNR